MTVRNCRKMNAEDMQENFLQLPKAKKEKNIMKNLNVAVKREVDRLGDMALKSVASAALKVTTVNVRTCCWFVLGQDRLPDGADKLRRI